jgi:serine protease AprX
MHVGDLDGARAWLSGNRAWTATVTVTVHEGQAPETGNPVLVQGATVTGTWSGGLSGTGTCTTGTGGTCSVTANNINKKKTSVTFTVNNVSKSNYSYVSTANHDPDGDSNGTSITVTRP